MLAGRFSGLRAPAGVMSRQAVCRRFASGGSAPGQSPARLQAVRTILERQESDASEVKQLTGQNRHLAQSELQQEKTVNFGDFFHHSQTLERLRVMPRDMSFYMANPHHEELMRKVGDILNKYANLPAVDPEKYHRPQFLSYEEYRDKLGLERLKPQDYRNIIRLVTRLSQVDPQFVNDEIVAIVEAFSKPSSTTALERPPKTLDAYGRAIAVGRRKESSARAMVAKSQPDIKGQVLVNGKPLSTAFPRLEHRNTIMYPLKVIDALEDFNVFITVQGGGLSGQADAVALAMSKAIVIHNPLLKRRLSKAGCLKTDRRKVERKKPGKLKARRSMTWVKR